MSKSYRDARTMPPLAFNLVVLLYHERVGLKGSSRLMELTAATKKPRSTVRWTLHRLMETDWVQRTENGAYKLTRNGAFWYEDYLQKQFLRREK